MNQSRSPLLIFVTRSLRVRVRTLLNILLTSLLVSSCIMVEKSKIVVTSALNNHDSVTTAANKPNDPSGNSVSEIYSEGSKIIWTAATGTITNYRISFAMGSTPAAGCASGSDVSNSTLEIDLTSLNPDTTYYYRVCSKNGSDLSDGVTGSFKTLKFAARSSVYPLFANWNDYLKNNGTKPYNATEVACDPSADYKPINCFNGGLFHKVIITGINDCSRLKVSDKLGLFQWRCDVSGSDAILYSFDFNPYKGLSDAISNNQFLDNYVIVKLDGVNTYSSIPEKWWTNVIENIPDSANGTTTILTNGVSTSGKIFTVSTVKTGGAYELNADKISIVVLKGASLVKDGSSNTVLISAPYANSRNFLWLEGSFSGNNVSTNVIQLYKTWHTRIHNAEIAYSTGSLVFVGYTTSAIKFTDFNMHHGVKGIENSSSSPGVYLIVSNGIFSQIDSYSMSYMNDSTVQRVVFASTSGGRAPLSYSTTSIHTNLTFANTTQTNSIYVFSSNSNLFHNALSVNASTDALYFYQAYSDTFSQMMLARSTSYEIIAASTNGSTKFTNNVVLENNTECYLNVNTPHDPGLNNSCAITGLSDALVSFPTFDMTKIFVGKVSQDNTNAQGATGTSAQSSITDWRFFDTPYRTWGVDGSAFPNTDNRGRCTSGNCRIWDYRLVADSANVAFNSTDTVTTKNGAFNAGVICPAAVHGNKSSSYIDGYAVTHTFLTNAMEILSDGIGNDDGLCESNEACIYTPNFGAYQGEGDYYNQGTCGFQNGTITGVKLYAYPTNGI